MTGDDDMDSRLHSPSILPLVQSLAATLADMDFVHQRELEAIDGGRGDAALKERRRRALERAHWERRAPYVQQLAVLRCRADEGRAEIGNDPFDRDAA
jgi:hypothetical protein